MHIFSCENQSGIIPLQHRAVLGSLIDAALIDASLRASDVDLVAVSTRPGIILSLKVGIEHALSFARFISNNGKIQKDLPDGWNLTAKKI